MKKTYSKIEPDKLLGQIINVSETEKGKMTFLSEERHFLQVAIGNSVPVERKFKPHFHLPCNKKADKTQEIFMVIKGEVKVNFYDLDNKPLSSSVLKDGDICFLFEGGHGFDIINPDSLFLEVKNGPYYGAEKDKKFID